MANENISNFEQLVPQLYGKYNPEIVKICQEKQNYYLENNYKFEELFQFLLKTKVPHFKFWLLDTLIQIVSQKYGNMSQETRKNFRLYILNMFNSDYENIFSEPFVMNRYCLLFNKFILYDFPENNNSIFNDIINAIYNIKDGNQKISKLNLLLQIFNCFNDEFIQYRHTYDEFKVNRTNKIKDYMRINIIPNLLSVIKNILENEEYLPDEKIVQKSLIIISQLIDWIPFEYFYNVCEIIIRKLIQKYKYFKPCCDVLFMIIKKGMDTKVKRDIINTIKINDLINNILTNKKKIDIDTLERISDIIDLLGNFIIENFEYTKQLIKNNNNNGNDIITESFNWSCNELRYYFYFLKEIITYNDQINYKEALVLCKSLDLIVLYFKSNDIILTKNNYVLDSFKETFGILEKTLSIPEEEYNLDENLTEEKNDDDFFTLRNDFSSIYKNAFYIDILREYIIDSILNNLINILKINDIQNLNQINLNKLNKYDIEFCLFLINILQEGIRGCDLNNKDNIGQKIAKIYNILFSFPFSRLENADFVLLTYYETFNKGMEHIINNKMAIEYIIKLFISEQGIFYNGKDFYKTKIVNCFDRFLSKIKKYLGKVKIDLDFNKFSNDIKDSISKLIIFIKNSKNYKLLESYTLLFHCYGLIITFDKNMENKINNYKQALEFFGNIINELNTNNAQANEDICEIILSCLIQFIQTVGIKIDSIDIKKLFSQFFDNFIGSYCIKIINNKNNSLLTKYINFLQRILIILGVDSLKYIEYFFQNNNYLNPNVITECLKLIQNSINSLKNGSKILVQKTFNTFYQFIEGFQFPKDNISDENKTLINIFLEFIKIFNNITLEICEVFFENNGINNLNFFNLIKSVLNIGSNFLEAQHRRTAIKSIKNLCKYFNKNKNLFQNYQNFPEIMGLILDGLFIIYSRNSKKDAIDLSSSVEIAQCHFFFIDFGNIYDHYLLKYLSQAEITQFKEIIKSVDYKKLKPSENLSAAFDHFANKLLNSVK
jgi:hypothetical protein